jgi:CRISPR/Cas system-associated exonuclease Cas4 (RecB family)
MRVFDAQNRAEFERYILSQADIVKIIGQYIVLTKKGQHYVGRCPFHPDGVDKELAVYPSRKSFLCWSKGCSNGSVFDFIAKIKEIRRDEAVNLVGRELGISISLLDDSPTEAKFRLSFTMLKLFDQCPLRYKYRYLDKKADQKTTPYLALGRILHKTLADFFSLTADQRSIDTLLSRLDANWKNSRIPDTEETAETKIKAEEILTAYCQQYEIKSQVWKVEAPIKYTMQGLSIVGVADRIDLLPDGTYEVIDYKTEPIDHSGRNNTQLAFYYYGVMESYHLSVSKLTIHYLTSGQAISLTASDAVLKEYIIAAFDSAKLIQNTQDFKPTRNEYCADCVLRPNCLECKPVVNKEGHNE